MFREEEFSMDIIILLAWFELLLMAPLGSLIMIIFDLVILAPTKSNVQNQFKERSAIARRLSTGVRRLSAIGNQVSNGIRRLSMVTKASEGDYQKKAQSVRKTILLDQKLVEKRRDMVSILAYSYNERHRQHVFNLDDASDHDIAQALYQKAIDSIKAYRRILREDELVDFDSQWECYFPEIDSSSGSRYNQFSQSLYTKIRRVQEHSSHEFSFLKDVPAHICGVEILKAFFTDLLGTY